MTKTHLVLGVHITNRLKNAVDVQKLLTEYGCNVKTRLGLHEVADDVCGPNGLLLLEMAGEVARGNELADKLNAIEGVEVKTLIFAHTDA
jgi:hypothetical protein